MLPRPAVSRGLERTRHYGLPSRHSWLLNRSRATNLAFLGLACVSALSFLLNIKLYLSPLDGTRFSNLPLDLDILAPAPRIRASNLNHLILVPGHGIWTGSNPELRLRSEEWAFQSYQADQESNLLALFFQHISTAVRLALNDQHSLVVFSGGQTQQESTTTEGESYLRLALKAGLFRSDTFDRATSEGYALDSFENLLFSVARFKEYTGTYPEKITVVGYEMKRARFVNLHRTALRWPESRFNYIGIDVDGDNSQAQQGERQNGYLPYSSDMYGCHSYLHNKRRQRNNARRFPPYHLTCPDLDPLFEWCPDNHTELFSGKLPWSDG
ncbi:hypothetical protein C8J57DRAFT_1284848 [Mycena rebaudengoi]|nr:hypothetical protein C8J57DRAFT_1284848 [Mycena rebaudengoi]